MAAIVNALARAYARTPTGLRALALRRPWRPLVLRLIFALMERQFARGQAAAAVVQWEIGTDPRIDRWQLVIADGRCRARRGAKLTPNVTLAVDDATFLDLITGSEPGTALFMSGRIRLEGDLMAGARLPGLFAIPQPGA